MTLRGYLLTAADCWGGQDGRRDALQCSTALKNGRASLWGESEDAARKVIKGFLTPAQKRVFSQEGCLTGGLAETGRNPREVLSCSAAQQPRWLHYLIKVPVKLSLQIITLQLGSKRVKKKSTNARPLIFL